MPLDTVNRFGGFCLDENAGALVNAAGVTVPLRAHSRALFKLLASEPARLFSKAEIKSHIWPDVVVTDDSLIQCVSDIRRAINDQQRSILKTVHRQGYRLIPDLPPLVLSNPSAATMVATLPTARRPTSGRRLIGRQTELDALEQVLASVQAGANRFALIVGEAGIGKTRLVDEVLQTAEQNRFLYATCSAYEFGSELGYATVTTWLRTAPIFQNIGRMDPACQREIARILPELELSAALAENTNAPPEPWIKVRLFACLHRAFTQLGRPLILVLDNLQWCDAESLQWLNYVLMQPGGAGLLVLATMRDEAPESKTSRTLMTNLAHAGQLKKVTLGPLSQSDCVALADMVSTKWSRQLDAAQLKKLTGGNPLFITETLRGSHPDGGGHSLTSDRLHEVIAYRLEGLELSTRQILRHAAAMGRSFGAMLLSRSTELPHDIVAIALATLEARRFIVADDTKPEYNFRHDLLRDAVYQQIDASEQRKIHRSIAAAISSIEPPRLDLRYELAMHCTKANQWEDALTHFQRAAWHAREHHASHAEAHSLRGALTGLEHLPPTIDNKQLQTEILLDLGLADSTNYGWGAESAEAAWELAYELAMDCGTTTLRARAINALDTSYRDTGQWHRCETLSAAAMDLLPDIHDPYLRQCLQSAQAALLLHIGSLPQAVSAYGAIIASSKELIMPSFNWFNTTFQIGAYFKSAQALWLMGRGDEARRRADIALNQSAAHADPFHRAITLFQIGLLYEYARDSGKVLEIASELADISARYQYSFYKAAADMMIALANLRQTNRKEELSIIESVTSSSHEMGARMFVPYQLGNLAEAQLVTGDADRALRTVRRALQASASTRNQYWDASLWIITGNCLLTQHGPDERTLQAYLRAAEIARTQSATMLELRAVQARHLAAPSPETLIELRRLRENVRGMAEISQGQQAAAPRVAPRRRASS